MNNLGSSGNGDNGISTFTNSNTNNFTPSVNDFTNIQLNTVSDMIKKLKENKTNELAIDILNNNSSGSKANE